MDAFEQSANLAIGEMKEQRMIGAITEREYRQRRRQLLERLYSQTMELPVVEWESPWALSQPKMLFLLAIMAGASVYMTYTLMPEAHSWIFR